VVATFIYTEGLYAKGKMMNVLVTSATSPLGEQIGAGLGVRHVVRLTDRALPAGKHDLVVAQLDHDLSTNLLVRGQDALVVVGAPLTDEADAAYLDSMTRGLYNLLWAAHLEKVTRVVFLSTLEQMASYSPELAVTERWRPRPTTDPDLLGKHLGEYVCREFAREQKLTVIVLRIGNVHMEDDSRVADDPMGLELGDLVQAIDLSLEAALPHWTVIHLQGEQAGARYTIEDAKRLLGFVPGGAAMHEGGL
jgi:nucleoside-diphosphate-sugar epimerase